MVDSPSSFKNYFKALVPVAGNEPGTLKILKSFYYGDTFRIIEGTKNDNEYPCLWAETPESSETETITQFNCAINIIWQVDKDDETKQDEAIDNGFQVATDIISKLEKDSSGSDKLFGFKKSSAKRFVITNWSSDNCYGCRLEFQLSNYVDFCFKPEKWN